ncbi:hypothetical protein [Streptosporangium sp. NPDC048865]|uniref:hypothetical protein n=1 Tax=Streptosporangium sp. NPDC048865 TaxID=3155766 RepID=UPI00342A9E3E
MNQAVTLGADRMMLRWMVKTRQYSLTSRRRLRRVALLAKSLHVDLTIEHDHGLLLRLNTITATGPTLNVRAFHRRVLRLWPAVQHPRWNR